MIIMKIMGGLGNQLFTYAVGYSLAKRLNVDMILDKQIYDTSYTLRTCQLDEFNVVYGKSLMSITLGRNKVMIKIYSRLHDLKLYHLLKAVKIDEKEQFKIQELPTDSKLNYHLRGYWQNYRYFDKYRHDLVQQFTVKKILNPELKKLINEVGTKQPIAMHIRRGDYKTFKGGKCLSLTYYHEAIRKMKSLVGDERDILVFTDDTDFCKEAFNGVRGILYVSDMLALTDVEEFNLMTQCSHFIIANSSFSWWAAYLCEMPDKVVIAPVVDMWGPDFYLPEWIKLNSTIEGGASIEGSACN